MELLYFDLNNTKYKCVRCLEIFNERVDVHNHLNQENKCKILNPKLLDKKYTSDEIEELEADSYLAFYPEIYEFIKKVDNFDEKIEENKMVCKYCFDKYESISSFEEHIKICKKKYVYRRCKKLYILDCDKKDLLSNDFDKIGITYFSESFDTSHIDEEMMKNIVLRCSLLYTFEMIMTNEKNHNFYINKQDSIYKIYDKDGIEDVSIKIIYLKIYKDIYDFYLKCLYEFKELNSEYHSEIYKTCKRCIVDDYFYINSESNHHMYIDLYEKYEESVEKLFG